MKTYRMYRVYYCKDGRRGSLQHQDFSDKAQAQAFSTEKQNAAGWRASDPITLH